MLPRSPQIPTYKYVRNHLSILVAARHTLSLYSFLQLPPQDRVEKVREFWEQLSQDARVELLTADVEALLERAEQMDIEAKTNPGRFVLHVVAANRAFLLQPTTNVLQPRRSELLALKPRARCQPPSCCNART
jgi:hypothetical protein